jgi:hypothetical protein
MSQPKSNNPQSAGSRPRGATGPRTTAGKNQSKFNALKVKFFARATLLDGESAAEREDLRRGIWKEVRPETQSEMEETEHLFDLYWLRRRVRRAKDAELAKAVQFSGQYSQEAQRQQAWDASHTGETTGGMLRYQWNPYVLQEAIASLTFMRNALDGGGFSAENPYPWILRKLYGLDHNGEASCDLLGDYHYCWLGACQMNASKEAWKKMAVAAFDSEIQRLRDLETKAISTDEQRGMLETTAALLPANDVLDRIIRSEAHISREIDRTLNRLEKLQRRRKGQPEPPTLEVRLEE